MRPGFCLSYHPTLGLRCDGCISDARRLADADEIDDFKEETPELHNDVK
jgi:hypothetical protein